MNKVIVLLTVQSVVLGVLVWYSLVWEQERSSSKHLSVIVLLHVQGVVLGVLVWEQERSSSKHLSVIVYTAYEQEIVAPASARSFIFKLV